MPRPWLLPILACLPLQAGCLLWYDRTDTIRREEEPVAVAFESEAAERLFADGLEKRQADSGLKQSSQRVSIPFLVSWSKSAKLSEAAFFNDQVKVCDRDGNHFLSTAEIVAYHKLITGKAAPLEKYQQVLEQQGDLKISGGKKVYQVWYPSAYLSAPELTLSHEVVRCACVEPSENGFRLTFKKAPEPLTLHWHARGRPWVEHGSIRFGLFGGLARGRVTDDDGDEDPVPPPVLTGATLESPSPVVGAE